MVRVIRLFQSIETLLSLVFGIGLGVLMGLPSTGFLVTFGWVLIPENLIELPFGKGVFLHPLGGGGFPEPTWVVWANWGVLLFTLLFLSYFFWCSCQVVLQTGEVKRGLLHAFVAAMVMLLSALFPCAIVMAISAGYIWNDPFYLVSAIESTALLFVPFCVAALLFGFGGARVGRRSFENRLSIGVSK